VLLVLLLLEGAASVARVAWLAATTDARPLAERAHTEYDPELGWVNRPHVSLPDLYGPGASFHTNGRRFRGRRETAARPPPGRIRVLCSGDSFALGYGVDDEATWCHRLETLEPRLEAVNMGQGGYGIDQSWLWFRRDGAPLEHQLHLFTFIVEDFVRMTATEFFGYPKPRLRLEPDGRIAVTNVPVPRGAFRAPWLARNARWLDELRVVRGLRALGEGAGLLRRPSPGDGGDHDLAPLAAAVLEELARSQHAAGRRLVLVWLPMREEHRGGANDPFRRFLAERASALGVPYFDLVEELRRLPAEEVPPLFLRAGEIDFPAADGHYSVSGNQRVAEWLLGRLRSEGLLPP
jgi:hypothetical protein